MGQSKESGVWDASECALILVDYQDRVLDQVFEQDRRVIVFNARTLAQVALAFNIPVILSTVAVKMGVNGPTLPSLKAALPNVEELDRVSMNAWEDKAFVSAVKATGRKKLVMGGILTSVCLAYPAVAALADGYDVMFIEDASADTYKYQHDIAVLRMATAGAVPNHTVAMLCEWFRDWTSPLADGFRKIIVPYTEEMSMLKRAPLFNQPIGVAPKKH
jgi:nicotinamidase-related amidase